MTLAKNVRRWYTLVSGINNGGNNGLGFSSSSMWILASYQEFYCIKTYFHTDEKLSENGCIKMFWNYVNIE